MPLGGHQPAANKMHIPKRIIKGAIAMPLWHVPCNEGGEHDGTAHRSQIAELQERGKIP
jgi:hypothetical protein